MGLTIPQSENAQEKAFYPTMLKDAERRGMWTVGREERGKGFKGVKTLIVSRHIYYMKFF